MSRSETRRTGEWKEALQTEGVAHMTALGQARRA